MRLSTRGRYGVRAMLDLAQHGGSGPVNLKEIAARQNISVDYLEQLLRRLRKANLVRSVRGPRGGFLLTRTPAEISLWDVVVALEQQVAPVFCVDEVVTGRAGRKSCTRTSECATHLLWAGLAEQVRSFLQANSLQDLVDSSARLCDGKANGHPLMFNI